jgi:predicted ribosome quality control (RQC) complex YloA/Tae2 family protein
MKSKGKGYRTIERDGWEILVGKGARDNDVLSIEIAEPLDYWFHVEEYSGSHMIIRCPDGCLAVGVL